MARSRKPAPPLMVCAGERMCVCGKIFGKKEDNFHFPIRARYAS
jgi:hypothetical protein